MKRFVCACACIPFLMFGCGGSDDGGKLDQQTAALAMSEAMTASNQAYGSFSAELGGTYSGTWVTGSANSFQVAGTVTSPHGGTLEVSGSGQEQGEGYALDMTFTFTNWTGPNGVVLNGTLHMEYEITSMTSYQMTVHYDGDLEVSGEASGKATFDMTITYSGAQSYSVCGKVGGIDISQGNC